MPTTPPIPTRKVRGDYKLERLAPDQHERLHRWLERENRTYVEIVQLIRTDFNLSVGKNAVAAYWRRHVLPHRYHEVAEDAVETAALPDLPETKFSEASLKLVRMHAYTALASAEPDLKTLARRYGLEDWKPAPIAQFGRLHFGPLAGPAQQFLFAWERQNRHS